MSWRIGSRPKEQWTNASAVDLLRLLGLADLARSLRVYAPIQARLASRSRISSRNTSDFGGAGGGPSAARGLFNRLMAWMVTNSTNAIMRKSKVVCRKAP